MRRRVSALLVVVVTAACGGEGGPVAPAEFVTGADEACTHLNNRILDLAGRDEKTARTNLVAALRRFREDMEDVGEPKGGERAYRDLLEGLRSLEASSQKGEDLAPATDTVARAAEVLQMKRCDLFNNMRGQAQDRLMQSRLRNAFAAETVHSTDQQVFTEDLAALQAIEPALTYAVGSQPAVTGTVYIRVIGPTLYVSGKSASGLCFYLRDQGDGPVAYAAGACGPAEAQRYGESW
jgi:hypothetical protein